MQNRITESEIESYAIALLEQHGYDYLFGPDITPDSDTPERGCTDLSPILNRQ